MIIISRPNCNRFTLSLTILLALQLCSVCGVVYGQTKPGRRGAAGVRQAAPAETPSPITSPRPAQRRVTVNLKNGDPVTGGLLKADGDTIELEVAGNRLTIKWDDVSSITVPEPGGVRREELAAGSGPGVVTAAPPDGADTAAQQAAPAAAPDPVGDWQLIAAGATGQTLPLGTLRIRKTEAGHSATLEAGSEQLTASTSLISGREVSLTFSNFEQGRVIKMSLAGTIDGDVIKGSMTVDQPGLPPGTFTATRSATAGTVTATGSGVLVIQAGIVYKVGGSQAVARVPFYLLNKDLNAILSEAGLQPDRGMSLLDTFAFATRFQGQSKYTQFYQTAMRALQPHIVAQTVTGFDGVGQFPAVPAGVYYVMGYTQTRRGFALWNVSVGIPTGQSSFVLDQNNAAIAL